MCNANYRDHPTDAGLLQGGASRRHPLIPLAPKCDNTKDKTSGPYWPSTPASHALGVAIPWYPYGTMLALVVPWRWSRVHYSWRA